MAQTVDSGSTGTVTVLLDHSTAPHEKVSPDQDLFLSLCNPPTSPQQFLSPLASPFVPSSPCPFEPAPLSSHCFADSPSEWHYQSGYSYPPRSFNPLRSRGPVNDYFVDSPGLGRRRVVLANLPPDITPRQLLRRILYTRYVRFVNIVAMGLDPQRNSGKTAVVEFTRPEYALRYAAFLRRIASPVVSAACPCGCQPAPKTQTSVQRGPRHIGFVDAYGDLWPMVVVLTGSAGAGTQNPSMPQTMARDRFEGSSGAVRWMVLAGLPMHHVHSMLVLLARVAIPQITSTSNDYSSVPNDGTMVDAMFYQKTETLVVEFASEHAARITKEHLARALLLSSNAERYAPWKVDPQLRSLNNIPKQSPVSPAAKDSFVPSSTGTVFCAEAAYIPSFCKPLMEGRFNGSQYRPTVVHSMRQIHAAAAASALAQPMRLPSSTAPTCGTETTWVEVDLVSELNPGVRPLVKTIVTSPCWRAMSMADFTRHAELLHIDSVDPAWNKLFDREDALAAAEAKDTSGGGFVISLRKLCRVRPRVQCAANLWMGLA